LSAHWTVNVTGVVSLAVTFVSTGFVLAVQLGATSPNVTE
jgi:hypothetical protein